MLFHDEHLRRAVEAVRDRVLELLRGVRLGEHLPEEELEEAAVFAEDVAVVQLLPALRILDLVVGPHRGAIRVRRRQQRHTRRDRDDAEDPLRVFRRKLDRRPHPVAAEPDQNRGVGVRGVHHADAVGRPPGAVPRLRAVGRVGEPVAASVVGDHAIATREVVHLRLPEARVADRIRRQEHDTRAPTAVELPIET
jgi:hypothetical protein